MKAETLTVKLSHDGVDRAHGRESLGSLLEKAISFMIPPAAEYGEHYQRKEGDACLLSGVFSHDAHCICVNLVDSHYLD